MNEVAVVEKTPREKRALELYANALTCLEDIQISFLKLGAVIHAYYEEKLWHEVGYQDFKQWCIEALGIHWRMALNYRTSFLKREQYDLSSKAIAAIGIGKMIQIAPVMKDKESADKWLATASEKGMTTEKLRTQVQEAQGKITQEEAEKGPQFFFVKLYQDQRDGIEKALVQAEKVTGNPNRGFNLDMIGFEFMATYPDEEIDRQTTVLRTIERAQVLLGVTIAKNSVIDNKTQAVLWG
jgi:hypothetical protein